MPLRHESGHAALFIGCRALLPCTVFEALEIAYLQQVAILGIDRTDDIVDECRIVIFLDGIIGE